LDFVGDVHGFNCLRVPGAAAIALRFLQQA